MKRWLPFLIVLIEAVLLITGVLTLREAAALLVALEGLLALVVVGEMALLLRAYRAARRGVDGAAMSKPAALSAALDAVLPPLIAYLVRQEFRVLGAIGAALRRRRAPGRVITYGGNLRILLIGMIAVSVVEIAVVELLVPWEWLRWTLGLLGVYGLIWAIGLTCSVYTRPHTVGPDHLHLRFTVFAELVVPTATVAAAGLSLRGSHRRTIETEGGTVSFSTLGTTNVFLRLDPPVEVHLGKAGTHMADTVRFYADDPTRALALFQPSPVAPDGRR